MSPTGSEGKKGLSAKIEKYKAILSQNPDSLVFAQLAEAYLEAGFVEQALETCEQGLKKHPNFVDGHYVRALALKELGRTDEAIEAFKLVLSLNPNHQLAQEQLEALLWDNVHDREDTVFPKHASQAHSVLTSTPTPRQRISPVSARRPRKSALAQQMEELSRKAEAKPIPWGKILAVFILLAAILGAAFLFEQWQKRQAKVLAEQLTSKAIDAVYYLQLTDLQKVRDQLLLLQPSMPQESNIEFSPVESAKLMVSAILYGEFDRTNVNLKRELAGFVSGTRPIPADDPMALTAAALAAFYTQNIGAASYYVSLGKTAGKLELLRTIVKAGVLVAEEDKDTAIALLTKACKAFPDSPLPQIRLARLFIETDQPNKAIRVLQDFERMQPLPRLGRYLKLEAFALTNQVSNQDRTLLEEVATGRSQDSNIPGFRVPCALGLAFILLNEEEPQRALELLESAIPAQEYDSGLFRYLLGRAQFESKADLKAAEANLNRAIELNGLRTEYAVWLIKLYYEQQRWRELVGVYEELGSDVLPEPRLWADIGEAYLRLRNYDMAATLLRRALFAMPGNAKVERNYALALIKAGAFPEAYKFIKQLKQQHPDSAEPFLLEAELYLAQKQTDKAVHALNLALEVDNTSAQAWYRLSKIKLDQGDLRGYLETVEKLYHANPAHTPGILLYADLLVERQDAAGLQKLFSHVSQKTCAGSRLKIRALLLKLFKALEYNSPREEYASAASSINIDDLNPCCGLQEAVQALIAASEGNADKAERLSHKALAKGSFCYETHLIIAGVMHLLNELNWEAVEFTGALDLNAALPEAVFHLGRIYYLRKELKRAESAFELAWNWYELIGNRTHRKAQILYYKALIAVERNDHKAARKLLKKALQTDPNFAMPYVALARYFYKGANNAKALELLRKALQIDPTLAEAVFEQGDVLRLMGRKNEAKQRFLKYLEMAPNGRDAELCKTYLLELK